MSDYPIIRYRRRGADSGASWIPTNTRILPEEDPPLPPSPAWTDRAPDELFFQGREEAFELLRNLPERGLAVVGTRHPQARSSSLVRQRIAELRSALRPGRAPIIVISGLALGIDAEAHRAALRAGLPTIAILGCALDDLYPRENRELADDILRAGGLLATEFAPGTPIRKHFFLRRNRLIAAWSKAVWIVEASHRSGALNTAAWARSHNRDSYATPCFPGDPALAGNQKLLAEPCADPLWDISDLKHTWPELEARPERQESRDAFTPDLFDSSRSDSGRLVAEVARCSAAQGGMRVEEALDWAVRQKWEPARFFDALRDSMSRDHLEDRDGILFAAAPRIQRT